MKCLILLLLALCQACNSAHILVFGILGSQSHKISFMPIVKALALRGHNVTVLTPFPKTEDVERVKEILLHNPLEKDGAFNWFQMNSIHPILLHYYIFKSAPLFLEPLYHSLMKNQEFQHVFRKEKVDLVMIDDSFNDICLPLIDALGVPFVYHSASTGYPWTWNAMGASQEFASVPTRFYGYDDDMNFYQRFQNTIGGLGVQLLRNFLLIPTIDSFVKKDFPHVRSVSAIEKDASLFFISSKLATTWPRPLPPTIVPLGALHVRPPNPLPQELDAFAEGSGEYGFILFSLGSLKSSKGMPDKYFQAFLKVFSQIPQRVIWKWDSDHIPDNVPSNILLSKWLPQQDILGHHKIRLFITHGGLLGMQEAVYHAVPLLSMPFGTDQHMNAAKGRKEGCGLKLDWQDLDENTLRQAITTILDEPSFKGNASRLSRLMRDELVNGTDTAVYWLEHVIRHNGTRHLKLGSQNMPFYQIYLLDVIAFIVMVVAFIISAVYVTFAFLMNKRINLRNKLINSNSKNHVKKTN